VSGARGAPAQAVADVRRTAAPLERRLVRVSANQALGAYRVLRVVDPAGPLPVPGQFAMLAAAERWGGGEDERPYLPRAFSIARVEGGEAHYLLDDVGPGTRRLCELGAGDAIWALGPLGRGFRLPAAGQHALLVGGGAGIAPLAILQDALEGRHAPLSDGAGSPGQAATSVTVMLGFRDRAHAAGAALLRDALLASDDGSAGRAGPVTDLLAAQLQRASDAVVYACGPAPMLEAVRELCEQLGVAAQLALEAGMACGFGACYGCVVQRRDGTYVRVCVDGPVLDAAELAAIDDHAGAPA
jgi:dihydroorotate dehydrogenase electron transfer subunit